MGITACLILTVSLITVIFYNHPSTTNVTLFFRTVPILPETNGRVAEIFVGNSGPIAKGALIFRLDSSKQEAAVETARRKIAEIEAQTAVARVDVVKAEGQLKEAQSNHQQTLDELEAKQELYRRNPGNAVPRDRAAPGTRKGPTGRNRCLRRCETKRRRADLGSSPGRKSQRRSRAGPGTS